MKRSMLLLFTLLFSAVAFSQTSQIIYNTIPKPLPGNVSSEGPEAYAFAELGDGLLLNATSGTISQITVVMSSWACQSGNWTASNCITASGATFAQNLTLNVYGLNGTAIDTTSLNTHISKIFNIPYRPSSDFVRCPQDDSGFSRWYNSKDKTCYHGLAVPVSFSGLHIPIPTNGQIAVTISFNTTSAGPVPIGPTAPCYATSAGCPYDSLNISTDTNNGIFGGSPIDPNGVFVNYIQTNYSCFGLSYPNSVPITTGTLTDDTGTGCWLGYHPEIQILAYTNGTHNSKGLTP